MRVTEISFCIFESDTSDNRIYLREKSNLTFFKYIRLSLVSLSKIQKEISVTLICHSQGTPSLVSLSDAPTLKNFEVFAIFLHILNFCVLLYSLRTRLSDQTGPKHPTVIHFPGNFAKSWYPRLREKRSQNPPKRFKTLQADLYVHGYLTRRKPAIVVTGNVSLI